MRGQLEERWAEQTEWRAYVERRGSLCVSLSARRSSLVESAQVACWP